MSTINEPTKTTAPEERDKIPQPLGWRLHPAVKEALWPLSSSGIFSISRALIFYWFVWGITTIAKADLGTTNHQPKNMALSMTSVKALWITIYLVGSTLRCFMVLNLTYLFFLLGLSCCTWALIRGYLKVVKPYHRGRYHLADVWILSRLAPLRKWSLRHLESGYPEIEGLIADVWEWMSIRAK